MVVSFTTDSSATDSGFNISMEFVYSSKWDSFQQMFIQYIIIKINKLKEKGEIIVLDALFFSVEDSPEGNQKKFSVPV